MILLIFLSLVNNLSGLPPYLSGISLSIIAQSLPFGNVELPICFMVPMLLLIKQIGRYIKVGQGQ